MNLPVKPDWRSADPRVQRLITLFEHLQASDVARLGECYAADARFKDPFQERVGLAGVQRVFAHMFESLEQPRFEVLEAISEGDQCVLTWDFHFRTRGRTMRIHGASHLRFDAQGKVALHRDYWDAAEELYEHLPLLGGLLRWLKRRLAAPA